MTPEPLQNPDANRLPDWAAEGQLEMAAAAAGYPLQTTVGNFLKAAGFYVQDEPPYFDDDGDSGTARALDLAARLPLTPELLKYEDKSLDLILTLLIECKRSTHPYVFFEAVNPPRISSFPTVGVTSSIRFTGDGEANVIRSAPLLDGLGLHSHSFVTAPPISASFSRAIKRKNIEFSGEEPFRAIVLPLIKASRYEEGQKGNRASGSAHLLLPVAVVDAPMAMIASDGADSTSQTLPWVRVIRWRVTQPRDRFITSRFDAIDVVHWAYFDRYVQEHLLPFVSLLQSESLHGCLSYWVAASGMSRT